jgi:hypothetical protein
VKERRERKETHQLLMLPTAKEKVESVFGAGRTTLGGREAAYSAETGSRGGHGQEEGDLLCEGGERRFEGERGVREEGFCARRGRVSS